jgi:hypothetical protein
MTVIDVHCRFTFGAADDSFRASMGGRAPAVLREGTKEGFFRELDRTGISTAVPARRSLREHGACCAASRGRPCGICGTNPVKRSGTTRLSVS